MEELRRRMSSAQGVGHPGRAGDAGPRRRDGAVPRQGQDHRRVLDAVGRRGRLAARGHDHARVARWRSARSRSCRPSRSTGLDVEDGPDPAGAHHRRRHRGRDRRDRLRRVEPEARRRWPARTIPLTPAVHQMICVGPCPQLAERPGEISFPIVRDMDTFCYERQHGADMEVGSYAHRAILHDPEDIPSIEQAQAVADRDAVHRRRLRPAARAGARADARRCSAPTGPRSATRSTACCR